MHAERFSIFFLYHFRIRRIQSNNEKVHKTITRLFGTILSVRMYCR